MSRHIIIDSSGHTTFEFDGANTTDLAEAERRFKKLMADGFIPAESKGEALATSNGELFGRGRFWLSSSNRI